MGLNLLSGANGAGKTSVLEGAHLLATGRSFRTARVGEVVARGEQALTIRGLAAEYGGEERHVGVEKSAGGRSTRLRYGGREMSTASEMARKMPIVSVTPDSQRMLTDGAEARRRLLDWTLFHVEQRFHEVNQIYRRALRQRNAALKDSRMAALTAWDEEVAITGEALGAVRRLHVEGMVTLLEELIADLTGIGVTIRYRQGWPEDQQLASVLRRSRARDLARGFTGDGPHRADLELRVDGHQAGQVLSRGEGKLLTVGLVLAQVRHLMLAKGRSAVVLMDDIASELDPDGRARVWGKLAEMEVQSLVTAVSPAAVPWREWPGSRSFHVERGRVSEMV